MSATKVDICPFRLPQCTTQYTQHSKECCLNSSSIASEYNIIGGHTAIKNLSEMEVLAYM